MSSSLHGTDLGEDKTSQAGAQGQPIRRERKIRRYGAHIQGCDRGEQWKAAAKRSKGESLSCQRELAGACGGACMRGLDGNYSGRGNSKKLGPKSRCVGKCDGGKEIERKMVEGEVVVMRNAWLWPLNLETKEEDPRVKGKRPESVQVVSSTCKAV